MALIGKENAIGSTLEANAVGSVEIVSNSVTASEIAANAIGASEIAANAVGTSEVATNAIGAAHSKKLNSDDSIVYSLHGDGELQEGQVWEALMYASAKNIDNLIATIDYNQKQIDGSIHDSLIH